MKEFSMGTRQSENVRCEHELIGGLKISSCEFLAKVVEAGTQRDGTIISVEETGTQEIPQWVREY